MIAHYYKDVPGWAAFAPLYFDVAKTLHDGMVMVEVGSWLGRSAALMGVEIANSGKQATLICVDPWVDGGPDLRDTKHFKNQTKPIIDQFIENTKPVRQHISMLRMTSLEAVSKFNDGSVDFLMLDGDHCYEAVKADIKAWLPKMKPGGLLTGDDYGWPGVNRAAHEAFGDRVNATWVKHHKNYLLGKSYWMVRV